MQTLEQLREQDRRATFGPGPVGLGGWLVLPMLGMFLTPVIGVLGINQLLPALDGGLALTSAQRLVIWLEVVTNIVFQGIAPIALLVLFFKRARRFPTLYAAWISLNLIIVLVDLVFAYNVFRDYYDTPGVTFWDQETTQLVGRSVFGVAIWVPYMINSRRVRNTFMN